MNKTIEVIRHTRQHLLKAVEGLSTEQLNKVPPGFNNNIIWNLAHLVAAQQNICYKRSGLAIVIDEQYFTPYLPGTKPERFIEANEIEVIKSLMFSTLDQLEADIQAKKFGAYQAWTTRYDVSLNNIDEAVGFVPFHEGIHTGYIWALKRVI